MLDLRLDSPSGSDVGGEPQLLAVHSWERGSCGNGDVSAGDRTSCVFSMYCKEQLFVIKS